LQSIAAGIDVSRKMWSGHTAYDGGRLDLQTVK
jgi:hypothetical protein